MGAFYFSSYDAAGRVLCFLEEIDSEYTEESILNMKYQYPPSPFHNSDGKEICSGHIDEFDFRILELSAGDEINFS